jgi:hypothetical protein
MRRHITGLEATYVAIESNKRGAITLAAPPSDPVDSGREIKPPALSEVPENARSAPPRVRKPKRNSDQYLAPTADLAAHRGELRQAFGKTLSDEFAEVMLGKLVEALSPGPNDGLDESTLNAAIALVTSMQPNTELEALIAVQIAATGFAGLKFLRQSQRHMDEVFISLYEDTRQSFFVYSSI